MDTIIQHRMINGGIERRQKRLEEGLNIKESFEAAKSMTAGVLAANGIYNLNNPEFLDYMKQKAAKEAAEEQERRKKAREDLLARIEQIKQFRLKRGWGETSGFKNWSCKEMQAYLQYKKVATDKAMPSRAALVRERVLQVMHRKSPTCSPHASDDEDNKPPTISPFEAPPSPQDLNPLLLLANLAPLEENHHGWSGTTENNGVVMEGRI